MNNKDRAGVWREAADWMQHRFSNAVTTAEAAHALRERALEIETPKPEWPNCVRMALYSDGSVGVWKDGDNTLENTVAKGEYVSVDRHASLMGSLTEELKNLRQSLKEAQVSARCAQGREKLLEMQVTELEDALLDSSR